MTPQLQAQYAVGRCRLSFLENGKGNERVQFWDNSQNAQREPVNGLWMLFSLTFSFDSNWRMDREISN
jgi:hypothetical protein